MKEQIMQTLAIAWKELQIILKDKGLLAVLIVLPLFLGTLFSQINQMAYISEEGEEIEQIVDVYVVNQDNGPFGQQVVDVLDQAGIMGMTMMNSTGEADRLVAEGQKMAAIIIPPDFSTLIDAHQPTAVMVIVDPVQEQFLSIVTGLVNFAVSPPTVQGEIQYGVRALLEESGLWEDSGEETRRAIAAQNIGVIMTQLQVMAENPLIEVISEEAGGEEATPPLNFFALMIPGFTVMFAFFLIGHIGASLHNERDSGTFRRLLAAPLGRATIIAGPVIAYTIVVAIQVFVLFGISAGIFGMPLGNNPLALLLTTIVLGITVSAMGLMLSAVTKSAQQADNIGMVLGFVLAGLGGAILVGGLTPLYQQGGFIGLLSNLTPHAHALEAYRLIMIADGSLGEILVQNVILLGFTAVFFVLAVRRLKFT